MCSSSPPPPAAAPDLSGQNAAAVQQAGISAEQLAWAKQIYAETAPDRAYAAEQAKKVSDAQLASMQTQSDMAKDYDTYNKGTFRPLEQSIVADASGYDTAGRRELKAGEAMANVGTQADAARGTVAREAMARGVDPSSGSFAATQGMLGVRTAAEQAAAGNTARTQVETIGVARKMDAANLGRNLASSQATSAGLALTAGNGATTNAQIPLNVAAGGAQILNAGASGAQAGLAGAAGTYGSMANIQNQTSNINQQAYATKSAANNGLWGALGTMGGAALSNAPKLMTMSDVNMKENITPTNPDEALKAIEATPVSNWNYKPGSPVDDGGEIHVGPMAQDVKKTMGAKAAPGGKKIDLIAMNGMAMAAIQGLSKKMDRFAAAAGMPA